MILRWFIYHFLFTAAVYFFYRDQIPFDDGKPAIFLASFGSLFFITWLILFFINRTYFFKLPKLFRFIGFIFKELLVSNFRVAHDILSPVQRMNPAIIAIPLDLTTDVEIVVLATLLTLTPGTLSLKISEDRKTLFIHEMYIPDNDIEAMKKKIKNDFERRIMELSRE